MNVIGLCNKIRQKSAQSEFSKSLKGQLPSPAMIFLILKSFLLSGTLALLTPVSTISCPASSPSLDLEQVRLTASLSSDSEKQWVAEASSLGVSSEAEQVVDLSSPPPGLRHTHTRRTVQG